MNRLSPLIVRRVGPLALQSIPASAPMAAEPAGKFHLPDDLRLVLLGWAGGLVFFGTFFG